MTTERRELTTYVKPGESGHDARERLCRHAIANGLAVAPYESRIFLVGDEDEWDLLVEVPILADPDFAVFDRHFGTSWLDAPFDDDDMEYYRRTRNDPSTLMVRDDDGNWVPDEGDDE